MTARRRLRRGERGVILVLVLWVFMTLGVLALDFSSYMRDDAMATVNLSDEARGYYMALAGMNAALYEHMKIRENQGPSGAPVADVDPQEKGEDHDGDGEPDDTVKFPADGVWREDSFGGGKFKVRLTGEDGKIPLNVDLNGDEGTMYRELVKYVITNIVRGGNQTTGVDKDTEQQISEITDSIIDWRDCDDEAQLNGAESDYYMGLARPHRAKNGFFDSPEELLQIRGVTPEIFYGNDESPGLGEVFSPYPRGKELVINAGQITLPVLRALAPGYQDTEKNFEDWKTGDPSDLQMWLQQQVDAVIPGLSTRIRIVEPEIIRIEARADTSQSRNQASVAAIVQMGGENDLPIVLSWLDRAPLPSDDGSDAKTSVPAPPGSGSS